MWCVVSDVFRANYNLIISDRPGQTRCQPALIDIPSLSGTVSQGRARPGQTRLQVAGEDCNAALHCSSAVVEDNEGSRCKVNSD